MKLSRIWNEADGLNKKLTVDEFYGNGLKNFMGRHFKVATIPWSHHVQGAVLPEDIGKCNLTQQIFGIIRDCVFYVILYCSNLFKTAQFIIFLATPRSKYNDYYGYEINILVETARVLNFTYTIENPPDGMVQNKYQLTL